MAPAEGDVRTDHVRVHSPRCPFCHAPVERGEALRVCASCHAFHHEGCWQEHGDCAACSQRPGQTTPRRSDTSAAPGRERAIWPALLWAVVLVVLAAMGLAWMIRGPRRSADRSRPQIERNEPPLQLSAMSSEAPSPGSQAPLADALERELPDGYSILASETERVESESFAADDLEAAIARTRTREGQLLWELRVTGARLPWRALYRAQGAWNDEGGSRFLLVAVGFAEGLGIVVKVSTPAVSPDGATELRRLTSTVESVKPLPPTKLWPAVALGLVGLPRGASGSIQPPRGWRRSVKCDDDQWVTWSGYGGDSIELIVTSRDQTVLGGKKVLVRPIGDGRRVLVICAYAATPARLEWVAAVAEACAATLELDE